MTRRGNGPTVELPTIPSPVVKHFRAVLGPVGRCHHCAWEQVEASLAECRVHVRHHPTHYVTRTTVDATNVWAEDRGGNVLTEGGHV